MKKAFLVFCLLAFVFCLATESSAAVIDFEGIAHEDDEVLYHGDSYEEDGFVITGFASVNDPFDPALATFGTLSEEYAGSTMLFIDNCEGLTVLTQSGGGTFTLNSIRLAELSAAGETFDVTFTGVLFDSTTVENTFSLDGNYGMEVFPFSAEFTNLISVRWYQADYFHQFDDIDVSPSQVPVPGAIWLFVSSLIAVIGWKKRGESTRRMIA